MQGLWSIKVRRGRDSNSRCGYKPHTHLAGGRLQPLGHLSIHGKNLCLEIALSPNDSGDHLQLSKIFDAKVTYLLLLTKLLSPYKLLPTDLLNGIFHFQR